MMPSRVLFFLTAFVTTNTVLKRKHCRVVAVAQWGLGDIGGESRVATDDVSMSALGHDSAIVTSSGLLYSL